MTVMTELFEMMKARANWLKREWQHGGDYNHLSTRRDETLYWMNKIHNLNGVVTREQIEADLYDSAPGTEAKV